MWATAIGIWVLTVAVLYALATSRKSSSGAAGDSGILERLKNEPALLAGFVSAVAALLAAFGLELNAEQTAAIVAACSAGLAIVVRQVVTPIRKIDDHSPDEG